MIQSSRPPPTKFLALMSTVAGAPLGPPKPSPAAKPRPHPAKKPVPCAKKQSSVGSSSNTVLLPASTRSRNVAVLRNLLNRAKFGPRPPRFPPPPELLQPLQPGLQPLPPPPKYPQLVLDIVVGPLPPPPSHCPHPLQLMLFLPRLFHRRQHRFLLLCRSLLLSQFKRSAHSMKLDKNGLVHRQVHHRFLLCRSLLLLFLRRLVHRHVHRSSRQFRSSTSRLSSSRQFGSTVP